MTNASDIMRVFDVPPWVAGPYRKPRFARVRWALRRWWKIKAEPTVKVCGPQNLAWAKREWVRPHGEPREQEPPFDS